MVLRRVLKVCNILQIVVLLYMTTVADSHFKGNDDQGHLKKDTSQRPETLTTDDSCRK